MDVHCNVIFPHHRFPTHQISKISTRNGWGLVSLELRSCSIARRIEKKPLAPSPASEPASNENNETANSLANGDGDEISASEALASSTSIAASLEFPDQAANPNSAMTSVHPTSLNCGRTD